MTHFCHIPLACALAAACLAACASLPDASTPPPNAPAVRVATSGPAPAQLAQRLARVMPDVKERAALEEAATGQPLIGGNKVSLLFDGPQTMQAMMDAVAGARQTINFETYIFDQDEIGNKFAELLMARQRQGVNVNVLYDAIGTLSVPRAFFERMRQAGIHLVAFNPVNPAARPGKWSPNQRDHRKLLVVDGKVAFTGGMNISADYASNSLFRSRGKSGANADVGWRDTHIRIEGPAVATLQWHFLNAWASQDAGELPDAPYFPKLATAGDKIVRVLADRPGRDFEIYRAFLLAIEQARRTIHITTAYFVPDRQVMDALLAAAARGVEISLVLPGVSDVDVVFYASHAYYDKLLEHGIHLYHLKGAVLHAKTAVIDGSWSTVGSANIDQRSFLYNYELNVVVYDPGFGRDMEAAFREDLRNSSEITPAVWAARPFGERLKEWSARLFGNWL
ncbi:MAG: cardiolipin synthase [Pseudomonadota bacterium]